MPSYSTLYGYNLPYRFEINSWSIPVNMDILSYDIAITSDVKPVNHSNAVMLRDTQLVNILSYQYLCLSSTPYHLTGVEIENDRCFIIPHSLNDTRNLKAGSSFLSRSNVTHYNDPFNQYVIIIGLNVKWHNTMMCTNHTIRLISKIYFTDTNSSNVKMRFGISHKCMCIVVYKFIQIMLIDHKIYKHMIAHFYIHRGPKRTHQVNLEKFAFLITT